MGHTEHRARKGGVIMDTKKAASADGQNNQHINLTEAAHFLQALDPEEGKFTFQTFGDSRKDSSLTGIFHGGFEDCKDQLKCLNEAGAGIFVTVCKTDGGGRKTENIVAVRAVFLDLDGAPLPESWPIDPHFIIETSPGRWHAYWLLEEGFPLDRFTETQKAIAARFKGDGSVCDLPRVMRLPGFFHQKEDPFLSRIVRDSSQTPRYTSNQILEAFPSAGHPPKNKTVVSVVPEEDPILQALTGKGMMIRKDPSEKGKYIITCPWADEHTNGNTEAAFWLSRHGGYDGYGFKCLHSHCAGQTIKNLKEYLGVDQDPWSEPEQLPNGLLPVQAFHYNLLPVSFRGWIKDIAERMQCPRDFPAVGAMIALAAVVGRKIAIRPKEHDDWAVVPNLFGGVIGHPGLSKTPALQQVMAPLKRLSCDSIKAFKQASIKWKGQEVIFEAKDKALASQLRKVTDEGGDSTEIEASLAKLWEANEPPVERRYVINDPTIESLQKILCENPLGVLLFRDELSGWFRLLDQAGRENDRGFYLESWSGDGSYTSDRIGRGKTHIPSVCLSILGGIQPGPLAEYIREATRNGRGADGLLQRFQLLVWPDPAGWEHVDRLPDTKAKDQAYGVFRRLDALDPLEIGAKEEEPDGIPFLRFDPEAQLVFNRWLRTLETTKVRSGEHSLLTGAFSKYRSLIPSLALLIHLADVGTGPVGVDSLLRAIEWGEYLESHMRRIYQGAEEPLFTAAKSLLKRIHDGEIGDGMTLREIGLKGWAGLDRVSLPAALEILNQYNWARAETIKPAGGGRSSVIIRINPQVFKTPNMPPSPEKMSIVGFVGSVGGGPISVENPDGADIKEKEECENEVPPTYIPTKPTKLKEEAKSSSSQKDPESPVPVLSPPGNSNCRSGIDPLSPGSAGSLSPFRQVLNAARERRAAKKLEEQATKKTEEGQSSSPLRRNSSTWVWSGPDPDEIAAAALDLDLYGTSEDDPPFVPQTHPDPESDGPLRAKIRAAVEKMECLPMEIRFPSGATSGERASKPRRTLRRGR